MKMNKKVLIPLFATAMGLSVIGGISGAVAWYQYNSKVTASFVGTSVADTGVLRIKEGADGAWTRAVERQNIDKIRPMTFGDTSNGVPTTNGWMYPEAGAGNGYYEGTDTMAGWVKAVEGQDYAQFDLYFDAYQTDKDEESGYKPVARDVFFNRVILKNTDTSTGKNASDAMRVQLDITDSSGTSHLILANGEYETKLYGPLDLDGSDTADKYHKTLFNELPAGAVDGDEIVYGEDTIKQKTKDIQDYVQTSGDVQEGNGATKLFTTMGSKTQFAHVVVTIWFEGWAKLEGEDKRAEWNANHTAEYDVQVGLEFSTGIFRGDDLSD